MQKLDGKTYPIVEENIEKLKELFPEIVTENKIDFDKLRLMMGDHVERDKERYEFTWNGKTEAIQLAQKQTTGTLRPCKEESVNWDTTENLYIEGDNLEVLRVLQNSYRNKVKMIYIDPPYNTGKDFVYKDDFHDNIANYKERMDESYKSNAETSGRYHTDWLNMMYPRLKIARNLLKEDGVIFISIDENEQVNLRKICDEIFGENNFISQLTLLCNPRGRSQDKYFATNHEYILVYSKSVLAKGSFSVKKEEEQIKKEYPETDKDGTKYRLIELRNTHREFGKHNRPNLYYPFFIDSLSGELYLTEKQGTTPVYPIWNDGYAGCWTWDKKKSSNSIANLEARKNRDGDWKIYRKNYADGAVRMLKTILMENDFYTEKGQQDIFDLFNTKFKIFESPKSLNLIKQLIKTRCSDNDIILDFFSGSSTTAHAVMDINAEDGGSRKYFMVQLPELTDEKSEAYKAGFKNICEIGKERIRRAGKKIIEKNKDKDGIEGLDVGFKVFKLDETNLKIWDEETPDLHTELWDQIEPIKEGRTHEDVVYEILLKYGIDLTVPIEEKQLNGKTVFSIGMDYLLVCLERDLTLDFIEEILKNHPDCKRVVFYDEGFKDDTVRINAEQLLKRYGIEDVRVI